MQYIPYDPALDPLGYALGQGIAGAFAQRAQNRDWRNTISTLFPQPGMNEYAGAADQWLDQPPGQQGGPSLGQVAQGMADQRPVNVAVLRKIRDPRMRQAVLDVIESRRMTPQEQARMAYTKALTQESQARAQQYGQPAAPTANDYKFYMARGYTAKQAKKILDMKFGLKPRPSTAAAPSLADEMNEWATIYRKARFDPVWGESVPELQEVANIAQDRINAITSQMKAGGHAPRPADLIKPLVGLKVDGKPLGARIPKLMREYPTLAGKMPLLSPDELKAVVEAVDAGMTEADILKHFKE